MDFFSENLSGIFLIAYVNLLKLETSLVTLPAGMNVVTESVSVPRAAIGRHVVKVVGRAGIDQPLIPLGQISFNIPRMYTPLPLPVYWSVGRCSM